MESQETRCYCHNCKKETYHTIVNSYSRDISFPIDEKYEIKIVEKYYFAVCGGCHSVAMCKEENDFADVYTKVYPGVTDIVENEEFKQYLPPKIYSIYCEAITAVNAKCKILAAVGFRSTIEAICNDKLSDGNQKLANCINLLYDRRIISKIDRDRLHAIRLEGNDSVHEQTLLSDNDLKMVVDIVEYLIKSLYVMEGKKTNLQKPITSFEEFEKVLKQCFTEESFHKVYTLPKLLKIRNDNRLLSVDLPNFESELRQRITDGGFKYLSIVDGNQYRVEGVIEFM